MRWYARRSKKKVWAETYGRGIVARRALNIVMARSIAASGQMQLMQIASSNAADAASKLAKSMAMANCIIATTEAVNKILSE